MPEQVPLLEQKWDCVEDCLLNRWSCLSCLSSESRFQEAQRILVSFWDDADNLNLMKARIVSLIFR